MSFRRSFLSEKIIPATLSMAMMFGATFSVLPAVLQAGTLEASAASSVSINTTNVKLYAMDDWADDYISIPSSYATGYQLRVTGAGKVSYQTNSDYISVSSSGMIRPCYDVCYWYDSGSGTIFGSSYIDPDRTPVRVTKYIDYGVSAVTVKADDKTFTVRVNVLDYVDTYIDNVMDSYIGRNITSGMSTYEKLVQIAKFIASYDYDPDYCSAEGMIVTGGGDCWASTETAIIMAQKLGLRAWSRDGSRDPNAGSAHRNAVITDGKDIYVLEAGYSGKAPRGWSVTKRSSYWSYRGSSDGTGIEIYQYDGESMPSVLKVPAKIDGKTVVGIADDFISMNTRVKEAVLPDTVKYIGENAFYGCSSLEKINIPTALTKIGERAFGGCDSLTEITTSGSRYKFTDGVLYYGTVLVACPAAEEVSITAGTKEIAAGAFSFNNRLLSVTIPSSVEKIGTGAFAQCKNLSGVTVNSTKIKTIPSYAFAYNDMDYFMVPDSVTAINAHAFDGYTGNSDILLIGKAGCSAERYAKANGHPFLDSSKTVKNTTKLSTASVSVGDTVKVTVSSTGGKAPYKYEVFHKYLSDSSYSEDSRTSGVSTTSIKAEKTGSCLVKTVVTDGYGIRQEKVVCVDIREPLRNTAVISSGRITLGQSVTVEANASGGFGSYSYSLEKKTDTGTWQSVVSAGTSGKMTYRPDTAGTFSLRAGARDSAGKVAYAYLSLTVAPKSLTNTSSISGSRTLVKRTVTVTGSAEGGAGGYSYALDYRLVGESGWTSACAFGTTPEMTFKPTKTGSYVLRVAVMDSSKTIAYKSFSLNVRSALNTAASFSPAAVIHGQTMTITCSASGGYGGYEYKLTYVAPGMSSWRTASAFSEKNVISYCPDTCGQYRFRLTVRDSEGFTFSREYSVEVAERPLKNASTLSAKKTELGSSVTVTCLASGSYAPFRYTVSYRHSDDSAYRTLCSDSTATKVTFRPDKKGSYTILVTVRDAKGGDDSKTLTLTVR